MMKKILIMAAAPVVLMAGCSSENQANTVADDATATTTEMPADETMGTTGNSAGTMQPDTTGATDTTGTTGSTGSTTDQMGRDQTTGTGSADKSSGSTTGAATPPQ